MMSTYQIESTAGVILGTYEGETPDQAIAAMMSDAGSDESPDDDLIARPLTYTVRPLGQVAWADSIPTLGEAKIKAAEARDRGLSGVVIVDDATDEVVSEE